MAWNQPGSGPQPGGDNGGDKGGAGGGNKPDPWGRRPKGTKSGPQASWLDRLFSGAGQGGGAGGGVADEKQIIRMVVFGIVALWFVMGFYRVEQAERAVLFRFGEFQSVETAGLHWHPPLIESVTKVNVERTEQMPLNATMITEDENIVEISLSVQYRIADPRLYLLAVADPESTLAHATESSLRHVVGSAKMTSVLNEGRAQIALEVQPRLQSYLDAYKTGLSVRNVNILEALPPKEVKASFDDVIRAKEDKERMKNQAETYANGIVPEARGQAARLVADATGYKQEVVDRAQGDASRFQGMLTEYRLNPSVMRSRLYLEAMEAVLGKTSKVVVESKGTAPVIYLPLDKLNNSAAANAPAATTPAANGQPGSVPAVNAATGSSTGAVVNVRDRDASRPGRNLEEAR